jgi:crossover junction endodeoxyribonuclease RuvC
VRVLGVDPGLTRCGVGVVEGVPGRPCTLVAYYVVYTDPADELSLRLLHLDRSLTELVAEHRPDSVAVERVFSLYSVRTVETPGQRDRGARRGSRQAARADLCPSEVKRR